MNIFLKQASEMKQDIISARRAIHSNGGVGFDLRENADFIIESLQAMGINAQEICPCGITATIGKGGKTILLRADYDALPFPEESGLPFAATNNTCHACGHDFNAASLLFAAKMLKEREDELSGTVKLVFQPAEELGKGAIAMIDAGVMENPRVDAAMSLHMGIGEEDTDLGDVCYTRGLRFAACDIYTITVIGKSAHGAFPFRGADPITTAARILLALQNIIPMEIDSAERAILTFGCINGGSAHNAIPDKVVLKGTLRTIDNDVRSFMKSRINEIASGIAKAMRCDAEVEIITSMPCTVMDPALCDAMHPYIEDVCQGTIHVGNKLAAMGSEDFSEFSERVPSMALQVGAGSPKQGYTYTVHNPKVVYNEDCLIYGAALFANLAFCWLRDNSG